MKSAKDIFENMPDVTVLYQSEDGELWLREIAAQNHAEILKMNNPDKYTGKVDIFNKHRS